jgi:hypothetical protein
MKNCHACTKRTVNGSLTCDGCRDKGHRDLNCEACAEVVIADRAHDQAAQTACISDAGYEDGRSVVGVRSAGAEVTKGLPSASRRPHLLRTGGIANGD